MAIPAYDSDRFSPAAAVATVRVRSLDSGADISALPNAVVETLGLEFTDTSYEIMAYDNSLRTCRSVQAEVVFLRGKFKGQFVVVDQEVGILGRNILNQFVVTLDGPRLTWDVR